MIRVFRTLPVLACTLALAILPNPRAEAAPLLQTMHSFQAANAFYPNEGKLLQGKDGNFYGTAEGGLFGRGVIFMMTPAGVLTTIANFGHDGSFSPTGPTGLVQDTNGTFYGTTSLGGGLNNGTFFKMTPAGEVIQLADFVTGTDTNGAGPGGALVKNTDGNFYGTSGGGLGGLGTVFKMTPQGDLTTLVLFSGNSATNKGSTPYPGLVRGIDGNFYGTTHRGGASDFGTAFKMTPDGFLTTLVEFPAGSPAAWAYLPNGLMQGSDGNFYGVSDGSTGGTVFKMTSAGEVTILAKYGDVSSDGKLVDLRSPSPPLVEGSAGVFYGTAAIGGASGRGIIFKLTSGGVFTTLVEFTGNGATNKGDRPGALMRGSDGFFYGTTEWGGAFDRGTAFKMTPDGVLTTLNEFNYTDGGLNPAAPLVQNTDGNLYGATNTGGASNLGTMFAMTSAGALTTLLEFTGNGATNRGSYPGTGLARGTDGNFYGTTDSGGANDLGTIFRMTPAGALTTLVDFTGNGATNRGSHPLRLALATVQAGGNFYGTTSHGNPTDGGTVFKMTPDGTLTTLVDFDNGATVIGANPAAGLTPDGIGYFYGTTYAGGAGNFGTVFKMAPGGALTTLVEFTGNGTAKRGANPAGELLLASDGKFYGTTAYGGANNLGTVFRMSPNGALATIVNFTGTTGAKKGSQPYGALLQGPDGNFYGTTSAGGKDNGGTVFMVTSNGALTTLANFAPYPKITGAHPYAGLVKGADNHMYGVSYDGGNNNGGTVFRLYFGPLPTTLPATTVEQTGATLEASVNPRGLPTNVSFEYSRFASFAAAVTVSAGTIPAGNTAQPVSLPVTGLTPNTKYHFRVVAQNAENALPQRGSARLFTTLP